MFEVPSTHVHTSYTPETQIFVSFPTMSHFRVTAQIDKSAPSDHNRIKRTAPTCFLYTSPLFRYAVRKSRYSNCPLSTFKKNIITFIKLKISKFPPKSFYGDHHQESVTKFCLQKRNNCRKSRVWTFSLP